ncbi:hypothetical protein [Micromonospora sediminimaris]|uniref:Uncharacterized protein n=1 Tax=Micromonospora sediminimaris TaxID=547162 RepID=A0A9W5XMC6_9ACTN|nr:hypothetical protein [Micromonospora sediminimaris]GIJ34653.1 hypothetical protein Vse01_38010 [Micromonospora sediminimaris]SFB82888.1 hypothetical protein SAMN05216284_101263 [Micromonospora sediminimaris]
MSAEAVGMHMPAVVTLDDVAAMNAADANGHRYETSPEGVLSVIPPPDSEHATIASRLFAWLIMAGWPAEQVLQAVGVRIPGRTETVVGFRIVDRDDAQTVTLHELGGDGRYVEQARMPLAWLLQTAPADHLD